MADLGGSKPDVFQRFSTFAIVNHLEKHAFCKACNLYLTLDELRQCFEGVKFPLTHEELCQVFREAGGNKTGYVAMDHIEKRLSCWKEGVKESHKNQKREAI